MALKLIEKGVITERTEIDAYYKGVDIGGAALARTQDNFTVVSAKAIGGTVLFEVVSTTDGSKRRIDTNDVFKIDGMEPQRFASIYGLTAQGVDVKQGKRRGRKPKAKMEQHG